MKFNNQRFIDNNVLELVWNNTKEAVFTIGYDGRILSAKRYLETIVEVVIG